jgi:hypothetical protein
MRTQDNVTKLGLKEDKDLAGTINNLFLLTEQTYNSEELL